MLCSDPSDEPPQDMRDTERKLRRAGGLLAVAVLVTLALLLLR
ncbi:morphogenic membrane protein MmpB [Streptomyces zingiberis]|nr:hypothetical protein [Streptomyces zingiberis]